MPALPLEGDDNVNIERLVEEPYDIERHGVRSFLPRNTMARNSSLHTAPVIRTNDTGGTVVSGLTGSTAQTSRELMLHVYTEKSSSHTLSKLDKVNIAQAAKEFVVGRIKFILPERKFQSFWQPNLLTNTPSYVDSFFAMYGSKYRDRKVHNQVLEQALQLWKAAAPKFKKIIDNHRSGVAQKMKSDILTGESLVCLVLLASVLCITYSLFISSSLCTIVS
jgi:hypothetical protein